MGNRGFKELICTTHGHELRAVGCWRAGGNTGGLWGQGRGGIEGETLGKL